MKKVNFEKEGESSTQGICIIMVIAALTSVKHKLEGKKINKQDWITKWTS